MNNGVPARAEIIETSPNELLESEHGKRLDPGAAQKTVGGDTDLVAVDERKRA